MKSILILGASLMQLPAIKAAKELGLEVFILDGNKNAPYRKSGDHFKVADLKDVDKVVAVAKKWHSKKPFSAVFTAGTDFSYTVSSVASALKIKGLPLQVAYKASNKEAMRECFKTNGVSIPAFYTIDFVPTKQEQNKLSFPLVVKPVDNMGARGIRLCFNFDELANGIKCALSYSRSSKAIVEEYINGKEYSIDALVENGEVTITGFAKRHIFFPPWFIEMGHTIPANIDDETYNAIVSEFKKGVKALGIDYGVAKGDMKWGTVSSSTDKNPTAYVGEIAARLSGGYMSGWTFPYSSGIELTKLAILIAIGERATPITATKNLFCSERAFISSVGRVKNIELERAYGCCESDKLKNIFVPIKNGDKVNFPTNNVEKCGNILYVDSDYKLACENGLRVAQTILIRLEANNKDTIKWMLYGKGCSEVPCQFNCNEVNNNLTLFAYLPKRNCSEGQSSILFLGKSLELSGVDWMGRNQDRLLEQLYSEGQFKQSPLLNEKETNKSYFFIPSRLFYSVIVHGSHQGFYWLLDYLDLLYKKGKVKQFLKQWSL